MKTRFCSLCLWAIFYFLGESRLLGTTQFFVGANQILPSSSRSIQLQQQQKDYQSVSQSAGYTLPSQSGRKLQLASVCGANPTPFSTSLYVTHIGDGTPFTEQDADEVLRLALEAYNQASRQQCDPTFRGLAGINVREIYYSDALDYIRLRYDFNGTCSGCLPSPENLDSGLGPMFGQVERLSSQAQATEGSGAVVVINGGSPQGQGQQSQGSATVSVTTSRANNGGQRQLNDDDKNSINLDKGDRIKGTMTQQRKLQEFAPGKWMSRQKNGKNNEDTSDPEPATTPGTSPVTTPATTPGTSTATTPGITPGTAPATSPGQLPPQLPAVCGCPSNGPDPRGPTTEEYAAVLNQLIQNARSQGTLSGVTRVEDIFEVGVAGTSTVLAAEEVREASGGCAPEDNEDFTSTVWIELSGSEQLQQQQEVPFETAVLETYNEMNLLSCDTPSFRKVATVDFQESLLSPDGATQWLKFEVGGKCVNCDPTALLLFDDASAGTAPDREFLPPARSRLETEIELAVQESQQGIMRMPPTASCACPLNEDDLLQRSPRSSEFSTTLQETLQILNDAGILSNSRQVVNVLEQDPPPFDPVCSAESIDFVSTVFVDFDGRPSLLQPDEITTLEGGFKESYNDLIFNGCDEYYREITEVRLIPGITRRRDRRHSRYLQQRPGSASNSSDVVDLQSELPSVYMAAGKCRSCPRSESGSFNLYDDAFRLRRLSLPGQRVETYACYTYSDSPRATPNFMQVHANENSKILTFDEDLFARRLQQCACADGAVPTGPYAPTDNEFIMEYNAKIVQYKDLGLVRNINAVMGLQEIPPYFVGVRFSIFFGSLDRLGQPPDSDYVSLVDQTNKFYRYRLQDYYDTSSPATLRSVTITWQSSTPRPDLNRLQVDFTAELIFDQSYTLPAKDQVMGVMESFEYVEYIVEYVWDVEVSNAFHTANSVRFTGTEAVVIDMGITFELRIGRSNERVSREEKEALASQVDQFFMDVLTDAGIAVSSFSSNIDVALTSTEDGVVLVDFDAAITFSKEYPLPDENDVIAIIRSADLEVLRTQYLSTLVVGLDIFSEPVELSVNDPP